jgi:hypothetical protein
VLAANDVVADGLDDAVLALVERRVLRSARRLDGARLGAEASASPTLERG